MRARSVVIFSICLIVGIVGLAPAGTLSPGPALATQGNDGNAGEGGPGRDPRFKNNRRSGKRPALTETQKIDIRIGKLKRFIKREEAYANTTDREFKKSRDEEGIDKALERIGRQKFDLGEQIDLFEAYEKELEHNVGVYEDLKKEIEGLSTSPYDNLKTKGGIRTTTFTFSRLRGGTGIVGIVGGLIADGLEKGIKSGLKRNALNKVRQLQGSQRDKLIVVYETLGRMYVERDALRDLEKVYKRYRSDRDTARVNAFRARVLIKDLERKKTRLNKKKTAKPKTRKSTRKTKRRSKKTRSGKRRKRSGVTVVTP